jgi:hydrogenase maturation protease
VSEQAGQAAVRVVGIGNELRGDDAAGLLVARLIRQRAEHEGIAVIEHEGEAIGLLELWEGAQAVVLVDALRSGAAAGTTRRIDASRDPVPAQLLGSHSTHALGIAEALELARAIDRLPERVTLYGVEGADFAAGAGLTQDVSQALEVLAEQVLGEAVAHANLIGLPHA